MVTSKTTTYSVLSCPVKNLTFYNENRKKPMANGIPANIGISLNALVKSGQLTQAQANLVGSANSTMMFGTLLDAMYSSESNSSCNSDTSDDPFAFLSETEQPMDKPPAAETGLFNAIMSLMPKDPAVEQQAPAEYEPATNSASSASSEAAKLNLLEQQLKNDVLLNWDATADTEKKSSTLYDFLISLMPRK